MTQLIQLNRRAGATPKKSRPARVLFISPRYVTAYFPIGLAYVSSYIRQFGHEVVPLNLNHYPAGKTNEVLAELLEKEEFDIIGITGITVAFVELENMVKFIKARTNTPVVLGGGITSCESELVMETIRPDYMVLSEGELIFRSLLEDVIMGEGDAKNVPGIWYWDGDKPATTGDGPSINNLDELPFPDLELFGIEREMELQSTVQISHHETRFHAGKTIPVTASRSCPFRCTFCYHAGMGKYRRHTMKNVVDHIEDLLSKVPATHVMIYDELFSANKKRIYEFCDLLEERNLKFTWFCQLRVDQLDQDLLVRMRESGCRHISYGFESGSDTILESMDKKIRADQITRAVAMTRAAKIGIQANFLFGDTAETEQTVQETLEFQKQNNLMFTDFSAVIPYPGTRLYTSAVERGLIKDRVAFMRAVCNISSYLWNHMINLTNFSDERFHELYVELRELNDMNHRTRPAIVNQAREVAPTKSEMEIECPSCGRIEHQVLPYPPGPVQPRSFIGIQGYNIVCDSCNRKMHLLANQIPHIGKLYQRFNKRLEELTDNKRPVVLLPAVDRYYGVITEDLALSELNVTGVLDSREHRFGETFFGEPVQELREEIVKQQKKDAMYVILPWVEYQEAMDLLKKAGVKNDSILCWNEMFVEELSKPEPEKLDRAPHAYPMPMSQVVG